MENYKISSPHKKKKRELQEALSFFHKCGSHQSRSIQQYEKPGSPFRSGLNANWKLTLAENIKFC
ncbi:hypothetical protein BSn5_01120 [Bacillus subtilis BSn5]|nr:hypothetical protein BSn5_01120 [Bacillus subtilis BSn5]